MRPAPTRRAASEPRTPVVLSSFGLIQLQTSTRPRAAAASAAPPAASR